MKLPLNELKSRIVKKDESENKRDRRKCCYYEDKYCTINHINCTGSGHCMSYEELYKNFSDVIVSTDTNNLTLISNKEKRKVFVLEIVTKERFKSLAKNISKISYDDVIVLSEYPENFKKYEIDKIIYCCGEHFLYADVVRCKFFNIMKKHIEIDLTLHFKGSIIQKNSINVDTIAFNYNKTIMIFNKNVDNYFSFKKEIINANTKEAIEKSKDKSGFILISTGQEVFDKLYIKTQKSNGCVIYLVLNYESSDWYYFKKYHFKTVYIQYTDHLFQCGVKFVDLKVDQIEKKVFLYIKIARFHKATENDTKNDFVYKNKRVLCTLVDDFYGLISFKSTK